MSVLLKICCIFSKHLFLKLLLGGCFCISTANQDNLKKRISSEYNCKYYCFPKPKCSNHSSKNSNDQLHEVSWSHVDNQSFESQLLNEGKSSIDQSRETSMLPDWVQYKSRKWRNMSMEPVFYLLIMDFDKVKTFNLVKDLKMKKNNKEYLLKIVYQPVLEESHYYKFIEVYNIICRTDRKMFAWSWKISLKNTNAILTASKNSY